jgi:hemerythrin superfamily protein
VFKSKGEKHANSKVKTLSPVDIEKLDKVQKCVEEITHIWRFEQALVEILGVNYEQNMDKSKIGQYLKWVATDTLKEEGDIIVSYGFDPKDVMGQVQNKAKRYFLELAEKV